MVTTRNSKVCKTLSCTIMEGSPIAGGPSASGTFVVKIGASVSKGIHTWSVSCQLIQGQMTAEHQPPPPHPGRACPCFVTLLLSTIRPKTQPSPKT